MSASFLVSPTHFPLTHRAGNEAHGQFQTSPDRSWLRAVVPIRGCFREFDYYTANIA